MAYLLQPITIDGGEYCISGDRTEALLSDSAISLGTDEWEIYRSIGPNESGGVKFAVSPCVAIVTVELTGATEVLDSGFDTITVEVNGSTVAYFESSDNGSGDENAIEPRSETVNINLSELVYDPCLGFVLHIYGSTGDSTANNDVFWNAKLTFI